MNGDLRATSRYGSVALAPGGDELAFTSDASGHAELWTIALAAGKPLGDPRRRTDLHERVGDLSYAPDGASLVFTVDHHGDSTPDIWRIGRSTAPERLWQTPEAEHWPRFSPDGRTLVMQREVAKFRYEIVTADLATRAVRQVIGDPAVSVEQPVWTRDGRTILAARTNDHQRGQLIAYDVAGRTSRTYEPPTKDGILWPHGSMPDGRVFVTATNGAGFLQAALTDLTTGVTTFLGPGDWDVEDVRLIAKSSALIVRNVRGQSELAWLDVPAGTLRVLSRAGCVSSTDVPMSIAADAAGEHVVIAREDADAPSRVMLFRSALGDAGDGESVVPQAQSKTTRDLVPAASRTYRTYDGRELDMFVYMPRDARLGSPPPVLVYPHGGPSFQARPRFRSDVQLLASRGFAVIEPNYRGSTGYGRAFEDLNDGDWGGGDVKDLFAAVDALGTEVDASRVGILGSSYGGYLALRALTLFPERLRGVVDMFGYTDLTRDRDEYMAKEAGSDLASLRLRSPVFSLETTKVPLLVFHGATDPEIPLSDSERLVAALRVKGAPVTFQVYANEGHGFSRPENRKDAYERIVAFFERTVGAR